MPIKFQEEIKKQKNLIIVFLVLVLLIGLIVWRGFFVVEQAPEMISQHYFKKINIDFDIFKNPLLEELQPVEKIPAFDGNFGRTNPFVPTF